MLNNLFSNIRKSFLIEKNDLTKVESYLAPMRMFFSCKKSHQCSANLAYFQSIFYDCSVLFSSSSLQLKYLLDIFVLCIMRHFYRIIYESSLYHALSLSGIEIFQLWVIHKLNRKS